MKRLKYILGGLALSFAFASISSAGSPYEPLGQKARSSDAVGSSKGLRFRWDIVSYNFRARPVTVSAGGKASARGSDESRITFTGSGTFGGAPTAVTGGGTWTTTDPKGTVTGEGTYQVKALVTFVGAPGEFGDPTERLVLSDQIASSADAHAGLAVLRIAYSDGSPGVLVVGSLLVGTPPPRLMGITAAKGFVAYWEREAPRPNVDGNRTLFHVLR